MHQLIVLFVVAIGFIAASPAGKSTSSSACNCGKCQWNKNTSFNLDSVRQRVTNGAQHAPPLRRNLPSFFFGAHTLIPEKKLSKVKVSRFGFFSLSACNKPRKSRNSEKKVSNLAMCCNYIMSATCQYCEWSSVLRASSSTRCVNWRLHKPRRTWLDIPHRLLRHYKTCFGETCNDCWGAN